MMIPPPMPVPTVMSTTSWCPLAAPRVNSAHAAAFASFSTTAGRRDIDLLLHRLVPPGQVRREQDGRPCPVDEASGPDADRLRPVTPPQFGDHIPDDLGRPRAGLAVNVVLQFLYDPAVLITTPAATFTSPTSTPVIRGTIARFFHWWQPYHRGRPRRLRSSGSRAVESVALASVASVSDAARPGAAGPGAAVAGASELGAAGLGTSELGAVGLGAAGVGAAGAGAAGAGAAGAGAAGLDASGAVASGAGVPRRGRSAPGAEP